MSNWTLIQKGSKNTWSLVPKGDRFSIGFRGGRGPVGPSAYDLAVANGFDGTESEWLDSLQGADGPNVVDSSTATNLSGILVGDSGSIRAANAGEVVSDAELASALANYYTQSAADALLGAKADKATTITINGNTQDLSASRSWTIPAPDLSGLVPYTGATANVDLGDNQLKSGPIVKRAGLAGESFGIELGNGISAGGSNHAYVRIKTNWGDMDLLSWGGKIAFGGAGNPIFTARSLLVDSNGYIGFASGAAFSQPPALQWLLDAANTIHQRNGLNAQRARWSKTWTSDTNFEAAQLDLTSSSIRFGSLRGSLGGATLGLDFGRWDSAGDWQSWLSIGTNATFAGTIISNGGVLYLSGGVNPTARLFAGDRELIRGYSWAFGEQPLMIIPSQGISFGASTLSSARLSTQSAGVLSVSTYGGVDGAGSVSLRNVIASGIIRFTTEPTQTPTGTTATITLSDGNHQTLALGSASGNVTATLTVPASSSAGTIIVTQGATVRDITWAVSSGTVQWMGGEPDWAADAISTSRMVAWRWNGSVMRLAASEVNS